ncbi:MAG TPA: PAS domain-containing sensor histidine kinase [Longimicrobiaceae bacterium]|nr:PAS domain-containing sensor histidine kinase [Longimicrobiaceae bacterium]
MARLRWWRRDGHPVEPDSRPSRSPSGTEDRFRNLVELSPDGILVHGEGIVLYINPAGVRLWGAADPEELLGSSVLDLVGPEYREIVQERIAELKTGQRPGALEQQITRRDGTKVDIESSTVPITYEGRPAAEVVVRDISARKQQERDLLEQRDQLALYAEDMDRLHELSLRLTSHLELEGVLREVLAAAVALQNADMGVLMLSSAGQQDLYTVASIGFSDEYLDLAGRVAVGMGACGTAVAERRAVIVEDVESDPIFAPYVEAARLADYRSVFSCPLYGRSGEILGTLATYFRERHSPSEREVRLVELYARQAAQLIESARLFERTQQAVQARNEVLAIVSHDLRNPVHLISSCADLLRDPSLPEERRCQQIEIMRRSADRMNRLIQDLLDVSVIEARGLSLERSPVNAAGLVREACEMIGQIAGRKALRIDCDVPETLPEIHADRDRILQVFSNLIGNAVKFTAEGGRISLRAVDRGEEIEFSVTDTGPGIPEAHLEHVFDRFWQAKHTSRTGAGLGLAIARGIVEPHGGRIWVESEVGRGSTFYFTLPVPRNADR